MSIVAQRKNDASIEFSYLSEYLRRSMFYDENLELYETLLEKRARLIDIMNIVEYSNSIDESRLRAIFSNIPEGVYMTQLSVYNQTIFFSGVSATRERISEYANNLSVAFSDIMLIYLFNDIENGFEFVLQLALD